MKDVFMTGTFEGWITGTVDGKPWYSNGHLMMPGNPPKDKRKCREVMNNAMERIAKEFCVNEQKNGICEAIAKHVVR
jgi:hypothetical protein